MLLEPVDPNERFRARRRQARKRRAIRRTGLLAVIALTAAMTALVLLHVYGVNGPWYWKWSWRRLPAWPLYASMLLTAAVPFGLAQYLYLRGGRIWLAVVMLAATTLALQLTAIAHQPPTGLRRD